VGFPLYQCRMRSDFVGRIRAECGGGERPILRRRRSLPFLKCPNSWNPDERYCDRDGDQDGEKGAEGGSKMNNGDGRQGEKESEQMRRD